MARPKKHDRAAAALRELIIAAETYRHVVAHQMGVGVTESQAMSHLTAATAMGQTELAEALGITTSSVTSLIDRMESAGLVRRQPHSRDRRRTVVQLTRYGTETIERTRVWFVRAFDHTADEQLDTVAETLNRIATDLRAATDDIPGR